MKKTTRLTINESLPFSVAYKQENDKSVCVVNQGELEEFISYHTRLKKSHKITSVAFYISAAALVVVSYLAMNQPQAIYIAS